MTIPFERLLGDLSVDAFFAHYYEKKPYLLHRGQEDFYQGILDLNDVHFLLSSVKDPVGVPFRLADGGRVPPAIPMTRAGYVDIGEMYEYYYKGMSIIFEHLDQRWAPLKALSEEFEKGFSQVDIPLLNLSKLVVFATPANSQALPPHYDPADLFILQLSGEKRWRLYDYETPLASMRHKLANPAVRPEVLACEPLDFVLKPGDLLYFPRGYVHEALTGDDHSLHLTLSIEEPLTWQTVMERFLMEQPEFRRTVPIHSVVNGRLSEAASIQVQEMMQALAASPHWVSAMQDVSMAPAPRGRDATGKTFARINDCHRLNAVTMLRCNVEHPPDVVVLGTEVRMDFGFGFVKGPLALYEALLFLRERRAPFCLADVPGSVSRDSKLALLRRLLRDGFLACCD